MAKKKSSTSTVAKAAAAAAAAAVASASTPDDRVLFFSNTDEDEDDDHELNAEVLEGLAQMDESSGGEILWWELYCDSPLDKAGMVRKLTTSEIKGLPGECLELGPGEYHVIARTKRGRFVKGTRQRIKISGFARPAAAATPATPTADPLLMMQQMEERLERKRMSARQDRWQEIKFWAPILAPIGIELAKGLFGNRGGESIKDLVGAMVGMKDLVGAGAGDKQVETLLRGIELARDMDTGKANGSTWPDVIANGVTSLAREFRPLAESAFKNRNGQQTTPPPALQFQTAPAGGGALPASSSSSPTPGGEVPQAPQDNAMIAMVEPLLRRLVADLEDFAMNAADPSLAAEALMVKIPRHFKSMVQPEQMKSWLTQPDWWQVLVSFHPPLQPYQAFCDDVRLELLQSLEPQAEDQVQE